LLPFAKSKASKSKAGVKTARLNRPGWPSQFVLVFVANLLVTVGGLVFFGHDGRLLTYATMAVAAALMQWLMLRGWKA
jgi:hypothetical protein